MSLSIVEIVWEDAESHDGPAVWHGPDEVQAFSVARGLNTSVGLLVHDGDSHVIIAGGLSDCGDLASLWKIPRALVRQQRYLALATDPGQVGGAVPDATGAS